MTGGDVADINNYFYTYYSLHMHDRAERLISFYNKSC